MPAPCTLRHVNPNLEARRLFVSAALTTQAARRLGGNITAGDAEELLALARSLSSVGGLAERAHQLRFEPPYPGVTAGVESVRGGIRLLLACAASGRGGPFGVVFTSLIPGRLPQVSVAPAGTPIPEGWLPP